MANQTASVTVSANVQPYVRGMAQAEQATTKAMGGMLGAVKKNEQSINKLSTSIALVGGAAVAAEGLAVKKFMDFDQAMSRVAATGQDAKNNLVELRQAAIEAGQATQYSATEAAQGITELAKAGVSATDILNGGLKGALSLAAAGQLSVADAAQDTATALAQFELQGTQASHVADLLAAGAGKASGDVSDMAMALNQSGLVAHQTGLSIEETTGALADFAYNGLIGSDAGTSFKTMLQALTPNSKQAAEAMKEIGFSAYDSQGNFVGLANVAQQLKDGLSKLTVEQQNATLKTIFGSDAVRAASILYKNGADGIQSWIDKTNDAGYAAESAATMQNNLAGDIEQLSGSFETLQIKVGSAANGPLRFFTQQVTNIVNAIGDLPSAVTGGFGLLLGSGGALALAAVGAAKVVQAITGIKAALAAMSISARTAGLALGAIGAVIAVASVAMAAWGASNAQAEAEVDSLTDALKEQNGVIGESYKQIIANSVSKDKIAGIFGGGLGGTNVTDLARDFGLSAEDVQNAILGVGDAYDTTKEKLRQFTDAGKGHAFDLQTYIDKQRKSTEKAQKRYEDYDDALGKSTEEQKNAQEATDANASATQKYAAALADGTSNAQTYAAALQEVVDEQTKASGQALSVRDAERSFQQSLDDAADSLKKNGKTLDIHTAKGRANQDALDSIARAGLSVIDSLNAQGASEKTLQGKMAATRKAFIQTAHQMGLSKGEAEKLANKLGLIPKNVHVNVSADTGGAQREIDNFIISNTGRKVQVQVDAVGGKTYSVAGSGVKFNAMGGLQTGPGTGTSDDILSWLSNGEFVVNAKATSKHLPLLEAINNGSDIPAYATGGYVKGHSLDYWSSKLLSRTETLQLQQQIRDEKRSLREKEKYKDKRGHEHSRLKLRGLDRKVAQAQLSDDERDLRDARTAASINRSRQGTIAQRIAKQDRADQAKQDAAEARSDFASGRGDLVRSARRGELRDSVTGGLDSALSVVDQVRAEATSKALSAKQRKDLNDAAGKAEAQLTSLYKQADGIEAKLDKAKDHLADMQQIASAASDTVKSVFNLGDAYNSTGTQYIDAKGNVSYDKSTIGYSSTSIEATAAKQAGYATSFATGLSTLQAKLGSSPASSAIVQQALAIFGGDPEQGLQFVQALNSMSATDLNAVKGSYNAISSAGTKAGQAASSADTAGGLSAASKAASDLAKSLDSVNKQIAGIGTTLTNAMLKPYGLKLDKSGNVVKRARGGLVGGSGGEDSVHLLASPTEFVVNPDATRANLPWLQAINSGRSLSALGQLGSSTAVNVTIPDGAFAGALDGASLTLLVDGKPIRAVVQSEFRGMARSARYATTGV